MDESLDNAYETGKEDGILTTVNKTYAWFKEEVAQYIPEEKHKEIINKLYRRISEDNKK